MSLFNRKTFLDGGIKSLGVHAGFDPIEIMTLGVTSTGELTGADAAAEAAAAGVEASAQAITASTEKNVDFQKWLWGEQKELSQPFVQAGQAGMGGLMEELGYTFKEGEFGAPGKERDLYDKKTKERRRIAEDFLRKEGTAIAQYAPHLAGDTDAVLAMMSGGSMGQGWDERWGKQAEEVIGLNREIEDIGDPSQLRGAGSWEKTGDGAFTAESMELDPGYQFRLGEGMKAIESSAAARGMQLSGKTLKGIGRYAQDYASGEFQNAYARRQQGISNLYNLASMGQASAAGQATQGGVMGGRVGQSILRGGQAQAQMHSDMGNIQAAQALAPWNTVMEVGGLASQYYNPGGGQTQQQQMLNEQW